MIGIYATLGDYSKYILEIDESNKAEIEKYLELASIDINRATLTRIEKKGFCNLTEKQRYLITKATCFQAQYIQEEGIYDSDDLASYSIGGDLTVNKKDAQTTYSKLKLSRQAYEYLKQSGLASRII